MVYLEFAQIEWLGFTVALLKSTASTFSGVSAICTWLPFLWFLWSCVRISIAHNLPELELHGNKWPQLRRKDIEKAKKQIRLYNSLLISLISNLPFRAKKHFLPFQWIHLSRVNFEVSHHYGSFQLLTCFWQVDHDDNGHELTEKLIVKDQSQ